MRFCCSGFVVITVPGHIGSCHDGGIKWKHFPRHWPFVRGIHRSPVNSPHKGQGRGALMFYLICAWINCWVNNHEASDLRCHRAYYDVIVMIWIIPMPNDIHIFCISHEMYTTKQLLCRSFSGGTRYVNDQVSQYNGGRCIGAKLVRCQQCPLCLSAHHYWRSCHIFYVSRYYLKNKTTYSRERPDRWDNGFVMFCEWKFSNHYNDDTISILASQITVDSFL